jgi:hypothetical protein
MHAPSRRIGTIAATAVVAAAVLATGSAASTKPASIQPVNAKQVAQLVQLQADRDGDETYVWIVNGVQRGMAFR